MGDNNVKGVYCMKLYGKYHWSEEGFKLVISAGIHKMLVRIANREYPDQTASSEAV